MASLEHGKVNSHVSLDDSTFIHTDDHLEKWCKTLILHLITGPGVRFGSPRPETRGGRGGRGHIPYRNCMLTMVLRDSLGE